MLGLQFCIGAVNDLYDEALDAQSKPFKPIPAGRVSRRPHGWSRPWPVGEGSSSRRWSGRPTRCRSSMAAAMLGCGLAYDVYLKPTAFGWVAFAVAFPILPLYAWYGAVGRCRRAGSCSFRSPRWPARHSASPTD